MRRRGIGRPAQPSLVGAAARTAVVVGTASAVSGKMAANQAAQAPQSAPANPAAFSDDVYQKLKNLGELHDAGILTDAEFQAKKTQLLA
jgi:hypothetical protein